MIPNVERVPVLEVVAAVIEGQGEQAGHVLIGQRKPGGKHALKWEFPGGKVEPGETPREALARELLEELGIEAEIADEIERYDFRYGSDLVTGGTITRLIFFRVTGFLGEPQNLDFAQIAWVPRTELPSYDFLEGDVEFVKRLAEDGRQKTEDRRQKTGELGP
jgi:8-oxo-dGTP diphosphatase